MQEATAVLHRCSFIPVGQLLEQTPEKPEEFFAEANLPAAYRVAPHLQRHPSYYQVEGKMLIFCDEHGSEIPDILVGLDPELNFRFSRLMTEGRTQLGRLISAAVRSNSFTTSQWDYGSACNRHNQGVYASAHMASYSEDFFRSPKINHAIAQVIIDEFTPGQVRVKEVGGGNCSDSWNAVSRFLPNTYTLDVINTDFCDRMDLLPDGQNPRLSFTTEVLDLTKPLPTLKENEKCNLIVAKYTFGCIWFKDDRTYYCKDGTWSRVFFRSKKFEGVELIDHVHVPIDIEREPFGLLIREAAPKHEGKYITIPYGLIRKVQEAFNTQLDDSGVFLIGDVSLFKNGYDGNFTPFLLTSNCHAAYRHLQLELVKQFLEILGYTVRLTPAIDWANERCMAQALQRKEGFNLARPEDLEDINQQTAIMEIKKPIRY